LKAPLGSPDWALLATYLFGAALGTWNSCLMVHDGAVHITAGWLGNAWDLFGSQFALRAFSILVSFGPAWWSRWAFELSAPAYVALAHVLYFAAPLLLWLALRAIEPYRLFSRLYLAVVLALIFFVSEVVLGLGVWMIWMAMVVDPARSTRQVALASMPLGLAMAFCHPAMGLMGIVYLLVGGALNRFRSFPHRALPATAAMSVFLLAAYFVGTRLLPSTNPTVLIVFEANRYDYVNPGWMMITLIRYPVLVALWLLLLAPGVLSARLGWRLSPSILLLVAMLGLWFAAAGTGLLTWVYSRHTAVYVMVSATALALVQPAVWAAEARRPLMLYAAVVAVAFASYNVDLFLFGRFVDRYPVQGIVDVEAPQEPAWPRRTMWSSLNRVFFKWGADADYVSEVVVTNYDWWYRVTLAFYSYFRSDRQRVLFHPLSQHNDWLPFECASLDQASALPHDASDRMFIGFLATHYCSR
jgi:hypothetical protein